MDDSSVPSNPLLQSHDEVELLSVQEVSVDDSRQGNGDHNEEELEKPAHQSQDGLSSNHAHRENVFKLWWVELSSIVFSLLCLATNFAVLAVLDGKQYQSWRIASVDFTPNAIISTIATFTKASLLLPVAEVITQLKWLYFQRRTQNLADLQIFDDASRGPLGSIRLLWTINMHSSIASLAAIVTILALAIEPFTQQVIRYPTRQSPVANASATISTIQSFTPANAYDATAGQGLADVTFLQELDIAANLGVFRPAADTVFSCPSGSCTWPKFSTLALCSYWEDISNLVHIACSNVDPESHFCSYRLDYGLGNQTTYAGQPFLGQLMAWNLWTTTNNHTYRPILWLNVSQDNFANSVPGVFAAFNIVRFEKWYNSTSAQAPADYRPVVLRHRFTWCAQYFGSTRFATGRLKDVPNIVVPLNFSSGISDTYLPNTDQIPLARLRQYSHTAEEYTINAAFSQQFQSSFTSVLHNDVFVPYADDEYLASYAGYLQYDIPSRYRAEYLAGTANGTNQTTKYLLYLANEGNISKTLENVGTSVTNQMRSAPGATNITGTIEYPTVFIEVVWPWLIYSAVLFVAAATLLVLAILLSRAPGSVIWKSSSLALVFHGLADKDVDDGLLSSHAMEAKANHMRARLCQDEMGNVRLEKSDALSQ